ncbi:MAG: hypothetical protein ACE5KV_09080 [Thermoplasmata archaeon]
MILPFSPYDSVKVIKNRIWIHRNEVLDALEVLENNKVRFYSYTYKAYMGGSWIPLLRFDNWEIGSHYDKYDENGSLVEQRPCPKKSLEEVAELAREFRRNLLTMDISGL